MEGFILANFKLDFFRNSIEKKEEEEEEEEEGEGEIDSRVGYADKPLRPRCPAGSFSLCLFACSLRVRAEHCPAAEAALRCAAKILCEKRASGSPRASPQSRGPTRVRELGEEASPVPSTASHSHTKFFQIKIIWLKK